MNNSYCLNSIVIKYKFNTIMKHRIQDSLSHRTDDIMLDYVYIKYVILKRYVG